MNYDDKRCEVIFDDGFIRIIYHEPSELALHDFMEYADTLYERNKDRFASYYLIIAPNGLPPFVSYVNHLRDLSQQFQDNSERVNYIAYLLPNVGLLGCLLTAATRHWRPTAQIRIFNMTQEAEAIAWLKSNQRNHPPE